MKRYEDVATDFYGTARGRKAALVARQTFEGSWRGARAPSSFPAESAQTGRVMALEVMSKGGTLYEHRFGAAGVPAFWLEGTNTLLVVPRHAFLSSKAATGNSRARRASARWNARWGLGSSRVTRWRIPKRPALRLQGAALRVVYRDRFGQLWQHPFGPGVRCWIGAGTPPSVLVVRGGRLRMTSRGLEG